MNAKFTNAIRWIHIATGLTLFVAFILVNQLQLENLRQLQGIPMILTVITGTILLVPFVRGQWRSYKRKRARARN
jgi:hypothetical protein